MFEPSRTFVQQGIPEPYVYALFLLFLQPVLHTLQNYFKQPYW